MLEWMPNNWQEALAPVIEREPNRQIEINRLWEFLENENDADYHPNEEDIFKAFDRTAFDDVRVVIIGQDPYPCRRCSTGIAFFADGNLTKSLRSIYNAIEHDLNRRPTANCPERWAEQGVLLLNSALTLRRVGNINMHKEPWKCFIQAVVEVLVGSGRPIHFMLWGTHAHAFERYANVPPCTVRKAYHPVADGPNNDMNFQTCRHFSAVNDILIARRGAMEREEEERIQGLNYEPIDWFPPAVPNQ